MTKFFEQIAELSGWLRIAASPLLIGLLIGAVVYFPDRTTTTLVIGICIAILGLLVGMLLATKIFKSKKGTIWFLSRTRATPDPDNKEEAR